MITTNRIITNRFKLEFQSKKANWTQTAGSVDWTEFFSRLTLYMEIFQVQETFCFQFQSTVQSFSVDWIMPGNSRVSGSVDWTEFSVDWIMPGLFFSLIQMKSKLFQNATGRTLALRVYANRQPGPICSSMHHQKHDQTSIKGFHTNLT